jgi:3-hydroxymyristoyl/3-hydroxydecanoyl-(acyl carrier protein) dehydratase
MDKIDLFFVIDENHPSIQGHFPGNPIIPAVVLLNNIQQLISKQVGYQLRILKLLYVKFMVPARPGEKIRLDANCNKDGLIMFDLVSNGIIIVTGIIETK